MRRAGSFASVTTVGGLLPPDLLERIRRGDPDLAGTKEESYHLDANVRIGEAVSQSWSRLSGSWRAFQSARAKEPEDSPATRVTRERWLLPLFDTLGYGRLAKAGAVEIDRRRFPISHKSVYPVPVHLLGAGTSLDERQRGVAGAARMSPHGLVQDFLNRSDDHLWGFLSNGLRLRVMRDHYSLTQQAYVEFDLEAMMEGDQFSDFFLLWSICHQSRVEHEQAAKCWLEVWANTSRTEGVRALDKLRDGVQTAIESLGSGFLRHEANTALREALESGALDKQDYYRQLLRLVYRLIFLFVAEERRTSRGMPYLLDPDASDTAKACYLEYYATERYRRLAGKRRGGRHADVWRGARFVMGELHNGCPALALPALGSELWAPNACSWLTQSECRNEDFLEAVRHLCFTFESGRQTPVNWRNMGAQELGSVYESLLEMHPRINKESDRGTLVLDTAAGHERRTTGSYYTPTSLVESLLDTALDPVLDEAVTKPNPAQAILDLTVCDPACGSGHFLMAAARRIAKRLAAVRSGDDEPSPNEFRRALRDVVGRCLYGVDMNPMAVELCKFSLWLEAIEPGKPLSFFDAHIQLGNALLGTTPALMAGGIPDDAFRPIEGDDTPVARQLRTLNRNERRSAQETFFTRLVAEREAKYDFVAARANEMEATPDDTIDGVRRKQRVWEQLTGSRGYDRQTFLADAWCAAFLWPKQAVASEMAITDDVWWSLQQNDGEPRRMRRIVQSLAREHAFFHWHLAFPNVFGQKRNLDEANDPTGWSGGFDVVLGNPPWERIKLQEKEFFASRSPQIANAPNKAARQRLIQQLAREDAPPEDKRLLADFLAAKRKAEGVSQLIRSGGRFPLTRTGDLNTYAVFAETGLRLVNPRGRAGLIVPTGIATDHSTKTFFGAAVNDHRLVSLFDFENRGALFPRVHRSYKFCLLTLVGEDRPHERAEFAFFLHRPDHLLEKERRFTLSAEDFRLFNPNTRTCPIFRTAKDMEIARKMYERAGVLWKEARDKEPEMNPWGVEFTRMFDMSNDSGLFKTREELEGDGFRLDGNVFTSETKRYLPLYEAKLFHHYDHRFATFQDASRTDRKNGRARAVESADKANPGFVVIPRYWVPEEEVLDRLDKVGSATLVDHDTLFKAERGARSGRARRASGLVCDREVGQARPGIAIRKITRATDERTTLAAMMPMVGSSDSGMLVLPGFSPSATSPDPRTSEHQSSGLSRRDQ